MKKRIVSLLLALLLMTALLTTGVLAANDGEITVTVCAYDYNAVDAGLNGASETGVIMEQEITIAEGTASDAAAMQAFQLAGISVTGLDTGYAGSINGLEGGTGGGYSGWCLGFYDASTGTFDDFSNWGLAYIVLEDGDRLEFHYSVNPDTTTDDIGNGWYGLPIFTSLDIGGVSFTLSRTSSYDENWNTITNYYINGTVIEGSGTEADPFVVTVPLAPGTDLTAVPVSYTASLNSHYGIVTGMADTMDLTSPAAVSISTRGGSSTAWYSMKAQVGYADVAADAWCYDSIMKAAEIGFVSADAEGKIYPEAQLTRGEFVSMLYALAGSPETDATANFEDVAADAEYAAAVAWAAEKGIVKGVSDTRFAPDQPVNREQMVTMLFRSSAPTGEYDWAELSAKYKDASSVSQYAQDSIAWAVSTGIVNGTAEDALAPLSTATRAEACTIIIRFNAADK